MTGKIILEMFPDCNLSCKFCYQTQLESNLNRKLLVEKNINALQNVYKQDKEIINRLENMCIHMWGGELFTFPELLPKYKEILTISSKYIPMNRIAMITTNLVYEDLTPLFSYFFHAKKLGFQTKLSCSFDLFGRYTSLKQLDLFYANSKNITNFTLELLITKQAIRILVDNKIENEIEKRALEIFNLLYSRDDIDILFNLMGGFHDIQNENPFYYMLPTSDDLIYFYKYLNKHYPKNSFLKWYNDRNIGNPVACECLNGKEYKQLIVFGEALPRDKNTCVIEFSNIDGSNYENFKDYSKEKLINWFENKFKCNTCEYKIYCHSICVQKLIISNLLDKCFMKEIFKDVFKN